MLFSRDRTPSRSRVFLQPRPMASSLMLFREPAKGIGRLQSGLSLKKMCFDKMSLPTICSCIRRRIRNCALWLVQLFLSANKDSCMSSLLKFCWQFCAGNCNHVCKYTVASACNTKQVECMQCGQAKAPLGGQYTIAHASPKEAPLCGCRAVCRCKSDLLGQLS